MDADPLDATECEYLRKPVGYLLHLDRAVEVMARRNACCKASFTPTGASQTIPVL